MISKHATPLYREGRESHAEAHREIAEDGRLRPLTTPSGNAPRTWRLQEGGAW